MRLLLTSYVVFLALAWVSFGHARAHTSLGANRDIYLHQQCWEEGMGDLRRMSCWAHQVDGHPVSEAECQARTDRELEAFRKAQEQFCNARVEGVNRVWEQRMEQECGE